MIFYHSWSEFQKLNFRFIVFLNNTWILNFFNINRIDLKSSRYNAVNPFKLFDMFFKFVLYRKPKPFNIGRIDLKFSRFNAAEPRDQIYLLKKSRIDLKIDKLTKKKYPAKFIFE